MTAKRCRRRQEVEKTCSRLGDLVGGTPSPTVWSSDGSFRGLFVLPHSRKAAALSGKR